MRDEGNHGHGDDLLVMVMPETRHDIALTVWPRANLTTKRREALQQGIAQFIRAAFRESTASDYRPTLTYPQSRFSFSRLAEELHQAFDDIESLHFANEDIVSPLSIARIANLRVDLV